MKFLIISFCSLFSIVSFSKDLSCSRNGTNVYYINGVLSKGQEETKIDSNKIQDIFKSQPGLIDSQNKVSFISIYNPSNGPLNDIAELYAEDYYYRTGKDDGFSVFMQIYQAKLNQAANPSILKKITQGGYLKQLKYKAERLKALAAERKYSTSALAVDQLKKINATVVNSVVSKMDDSVRDGKKSLFIAHSQGNAVIKEAFRRTSNNENYQDYLKKIIGVFHIASPVQNLSAHTTNVRSFLLSNDWIVNIANELFPEFGKGPASHTLDSSSLTLTAQDYDEFNHNFSAVYLNPNAGANDGVISKNMRTIFKERLSDLATDLQSNCSNVSINYSTIDISRFDFTGYFTSDISSYKKLTFNWDFGDGTKTVSTAEEARSSTVMHKFSSTGIFEVKLTIDDGEGNIEKTSLMVTAFRTSQPYGVPKSVMCILGPGSTSIGQDPNITYVRGCYGMKIEYHNQYGEVSTKTMSPFFGHSDVPDGTVEAFFKEGEYDVHLGPWQCVCPIGTPSNVNEIPL